MSARLILDMPEAEYHSSPALSSSGAKKLLPPSCPALFKWERDNGRPPKATFDDGHAAHGKVLGVGEELVVVEADDWRTKAAQEARKAAYAEGKVPVLAATAAKVDAMAAALRQHPIASALIDHDHGTPEASIFWRDEEHDIDRRARLDWLPNTDGGRLVIGDYKTTVSAEPQAFGRAAFTYGYDMQAVFYMDAARALGLAEDISFRFVAQEKTAPYLVTVYELDAYSLALGRVRVDQALATYRACIDADEWPSYSPDVAFIAPPPWLAREYGLEDMELTWT